MQVACKLVGVTSVVCTCLTGSNTARFLPRQIMDTKLLRQHQQETLVFWDPLVCCPNNTTGDGSLKPSQVQSKIRPAAATVPGVP